MHSTPVHLGTRTANAAGVVTYSFTVPRDAPAGAHSLIFAGPAKSVAFDFVLSTSTSGAGVGNGSHTNLSATGDDVVSPTLLGLLLVLSGAALLYVVRWRFVYRGRHS